MASSPKSKAKKWHPEDIKAEIRKRGGTIGRVARAAGLADVSGRVAFLHPVPTANRAIAEFIGVPVNELWPQWFDAKGNRKSSISSNENSPKARRGHRQKTVAK
ncbi:helix-turn-helix domain-containing protein [Magnetospirillum fulvum]|uniref:Phage DNA-binding protein Ner n=1 Tax=Magnetospirillum fulvum MGU-K5 TaxID=1316936 RepID=S9SAZ1_MAGFU|nr:helix-turn-helix domain-containing protein [Magnetospirillum fulvum]EPY01879.1 phage DNA-binding protein Ner [Magnetospirillum fulvum MGU-K5]